MQNKRERSPGGILALWVFYAFCGYFIWTVMHYMWVIGKVTTFLDSLAGDDPCVISSKLLGVMLRFMALSAVGAILASIAWYTRPRDVPDQ
ncbi:MULTISPECIES: cell division protein DrpB [unclassified Leclercia]|uniref:Cell division protein DrpB n=1 Tax=Leclercia barmai TaxID=2785629 RepID=A0ABS7RQS3_9ENTR|nr:MULTISPECIES: cell division protein DrpB [unclassified Leclercia]MBZ0056683.1 hypothetical protein [Leclercia sp. EMC7]MCM5694645.1 cell division protein DrpB [Leclercia sp. LTM01]MCM5698973.1 cell division protein DrpB [Leclercia sp. LTM14]